MSEVQEETKRSDNLRIRMFPSEKQLVEDIAIECGYKNNVATFCRQILLQECGLKEHEIRKARASKEQIAQEIAAGNVMLVQLYKAASALERRISGNHLTRKAQENLQTAETIIEMCKQVGAEFKTISDNCEQLFEEVKAAQNNGEDGDDNWS